VAPGNGSELPTRQRGGEGPGHSGGGGLSSYA